MKFNDEPNENNIHVSKALNTWMEGKSQTMWTHVTPRLLDIADHQKSSPIEFEKLNKDLILKAITSGAPVTELWGEHLRKERKTWTKAAIREWISETLKGKILPLKQKWEQFIRDFMPDFSNTTKSTQQTCEMRIAGAVDVAVPPETMLVWNVNGVRARWDKTPNEIQQIVQSTNPDVFCILEAKTDAVNACKMKGFEEWARGAGFRAIHCYWSHKEDGKVSYGNEGIMLFTKSKYEQVTYGVGDKALNEQARAITIEFEDCVMVFTYNPQGGFQQKSLDYRTNWEVALGKHLERVKKRADSQAKKVIWAGDLNVNPTVTDWSPRAFDNIRSKIPKGTQVAGCRQIDQKVYRELIAKIDGINLADLYPDEKLGTCFPSEEYLFSHFGQRIDHIIAQKSLVDDSAKLRVHGFKTLQEFGGSRKGSSDHCPLLCRLDRGDCASVTAVELEHSNAVPVVDLNDPTTKRILELSKELLPADLKMSKEFEDGESETDEDNPDDVLSVKHDNTECPEDVQMSIISCTVTGKDARHAAPIQARVLVDSGSELDIISAKLARKLIEAGVVTYPVKPIKIQVATGDKGTIKEGMLISLGIGGVQSDMWKFVILENLPFDVLLGARVLAKWKSTLSFEDFTFQAQPCEADKRVTVRWEPVNGRHWRKSVTLVSLENVTIPAESQIIVPVDNYSRQWKDFWNMGTH